MGIQDKTVVIVGAGISGLKAASRLFEGGVKNCVVLEARKRIGGRLHTVIGYHGRKYDMGASWHHDTLVNNLFMEEALFSKKTGEKRFVFDDDFPVIIDETKGSVQFNPDLQLELLDEELAGFVDMEYRQKLGTPDYSFRDIILKYLFERRQFLTDEQIRYLPQVSRLLELWHGISWENMSAKDSYFGHQGRNAMALHYDKVVERIASTFPKEWIKLDTEVKSIKRQDSVLVTTSDMTQYKADYVIVTIPQNVLKLSLKDRDVPGRIEFEPPLNSRIQKAFKSIHFGNLGKVVFEFEKCCWSTKSTRIVTLAKANSDIVSQVRKSTSWEELLNHSKGDGLKDTSSPWNFPLSFINLSKSTGIPSLVMLMQDPLTQHVESFNGDKNSIFEFFKPVLDKVMVNLGSKPVLNGIDGEILGNGNPILKNVISTNWNADCFSRGAYSACYVGDDALDMVTAMEHGQDSRIRFAGEHTVMDGAGCAYGSYESGAREADYVLETVRH